MIEVIDLWKSFGDNHVLKGITLTIRDGETFVVLGGSGSGKTPAKPKEHGRAVNEEKK